MKFEQERKWEEIVPRNEWLFFGERRDNMSEFELHLCQTAEWWRYRCNKYYDVLRDVCLKYCRDESVDEASVPYGHVPLTSNEDEILMSILKVLELNEGDPEYLIWPPELNDPY